MKTLDGAELAGYIKERQLKQVRALRQSWRVIPRLAIISDSDNPTTEVYMRLKKQYGEDITIEVDVYKLADDEIAEKIEALNNDETVQGIIVQLPLLDPSLTDKVINMVDPEKDVDGLGNESKFTPATAMAINWLLVGYDVELSGKKIAVVGNGRLVGAPLARLWRESGFDVSVYDDKTLDLASAIKDADVIVTATGVPGLIKTDMIKSGAALVDAGTAAEHGKIVGDVAAEVRDRNDIIITPIKGGVGPLTVAALFDNVITAARKIADRQGQKDL